jgi:hypothetical protein
MGMRPNPAPSLAVLVLMVSGLAACHGGGGGSSPPPNLPPPNPPPLPSVLLFDGYLSWHRDGYLVTDTGRILISGGIEDPYLPVTACPDDGIIPQTLTVTWTNQANGDSGTVDLAVFCTYSSFFGLILRGLGNEFVIDDITLVFGDNPIRLEVFDDGVAIGLDTILVVNRDVIAPEITERYPNNGDGGVPVNRSIVVVFSEPMNPPSLTSERFVVEDDLGNVVPGTYSYSEDHSTWQFHPDANLAPMTTYSVTISGDVEDLQGPNVLGSEQITSFTTASSEDLTAPTVTQSWPGPSCNCARVTTRILARLSEPLDADSIMPSSIILRDSLNNPITGTLEYQDLDYLEFVADQPLVAGETYTATITAGLRDLAGLVLDSDFPFTFTTESRAPLGVWTAMAVDPQMPGLASPATVWTGSEVIFWGTNGGGRYDAAADTWNVGLPLSGAPAPRAGQSATWTGEEMIIWGGRYGDMLTPDGASYVPDAVSWVTLIQPDAIATPPTYNHTAIWTGTELFVWGGRTFEAATPDAPFSVNQGLRYNPASDSWFDMSTVNAPSARYGAKAVWTGTEVIVWGGYNDEGDGLTDGARYNPVADAWTPMSAIDPLFEIGPRSFAVPASDAPFNTAWTGTEMLVWNGGRTNALQTVNDQFREPMLRFYDPIADSWRTSASGWEPFFLSPYLFTAGYEAFWSGTRLLAFSRNPNLDGAYIYDPDADSWQPLMTNLVTSRRGPGSVWAGNRVVLWSGVDNVLPVQDGYVFQP